MDKLSIPLPIIVEGKYDKIKVLSVANATVLTTNGFSVFKKEETLALFRRLANENGVILITDSDGGGKQIRSFLSSALPKDKLFHLYVPRIEGKEKRKKTPSRSGILGVEGMEVELLRSLLSPFASHKETRPRFEIDKRRLFLDGLSGTENASERRRALCLALSLPPDLTSNALLAALPLLCTEEDYKNALHSII